MTACRKEIQALTNKGTFKIADIPEGLINKDLLPLMWVFKYKTDSDGYISKFKSRLVARGDLQNTEEETYAATVAIQTFRAMMALTAAFNLEAKAYDVMNAYVNSPLRKTLCC